MLRILFTDSLAEVNGKKNNEMCIYFGNMEA
jgi:hypothetical protein